MGSVNQGRILWTAVFVWSASVTMTTAEGNATTGQAMWPDYALFSNPSDSGGYGYFTRIPFTYYESISNYLQFRLGYMTFGSDYRGTQPPPPAEWPANPKIMGIYWTSVKIDEDSTRNSSYYYYDHQRLVNNITYENSLIKYVKSVISEADFEPLVIISVTWEHISPASQKNDTATFQVILATDSQVTYAIRGYESVWESPELANQTYLAGTYSRGYGESPNTTIPGSLKGPEVIRLGTKKPTRDPYTCVEKAQTALARLNSSLNLLPPCPCFQVQAATDPQFNTSSTYPNCYQSVSPPPGGSLLQFCCYSQYGVLINYTREARVPVSADSTDRSLQEAYERCCAVGSGLCDWFYYLIPTIQCANYTPAVNASELPSFVTRDDERIHKSQGPITTVYFSFRNTSAVILRASTNFSSSHGFTVDPSSFTWNLGAGRDELRKVSYPQRLVFYITDSNNMSGSYAPIYKLCLCEQDEQCDLNAYSIAVTSQRLGMKTFTGLDNYEPGNVNSMVCNCGRNSTGKFCEKPINACDNCLIQDTPICDANLWDSCLPCPVGYQREGTQCQVQAMWPDYALYSKPSRPGGITYFISIPFTYYETITNTIYFNLGYVAFGGEYPGDQPPPPAEWPANPKILGIYWTPIKIDKKKARRSSYYYFDDKRLNNVTHENSLIKYIKRVISEADFEPLVIFALTWRNISPISPNSDTAAFQVIIATDSQVTYAIRGYESVWKSPELASQTYYAATYSRGYGEQPNIRIAGSQKGPEVIRLGNKKPTRDPYTCVKKAKTAIARLKSSLNLLSPCPCFQVQAAKDPQFNASYFYPNCYQSVSPPPGGSLLQFCCYSQYGVLINYTREARVPMSADSTDRSLQEAYERCCAVGSGLCDWFYNRIPTIQCANYTPAVNASEPPSFVARDDDRVYKSQGPINIEYFSFKNTSAVILRASTNFNSSHGFSVDSRRFTWNLRAGRDELRKVSYPQRLVFYVTDANNMSGSYAPIFKLCLCDQDSQCDLHFFPIAGTRPRIGMNTFIGLDSYEPGNVNSMVCNCGRNSTGRFCEKPINVCDNCLIQDTPICDANLWDSCLTCPIGYQREGTQCQVQAMWPDYALYSKPSGPGGSTYFISIPFTYYETITNTIYFNLGYVAFGGYYPSDPPPPPAEWPANPKILGIYWTPIKIDKEKARDSSYYYFDDGRLNNVTHENSLISYVKRVISEADFEPLAIFALTWRNISPILPNSDTAAFQVIIATDSQVTYAIRGYESVWKSPELASQTYYAATYSRGYGESPNIRIAGSQKGPEVIRLGTKKPTRDPFICVEKAQTAIARLKSSLNLLPPCPCFQVQAARDPQFNASYFYPNCYQSVSPPPGGSLLQFCCYSQYRVLINYTREARVPVSADSTDRSLQEAYERCCAVGSGLCDWFYYRIPVIQCANYTPAVNASEPPSFVARDDERVYKSQGPISSVYFSFKNTSPVILRASTNFNSSHGFSVDSTSFTWNLRAGRDELRKVSYPQRLVFYVTDANNMSGSYAPIYKLCLCDQDSQCDLNFFPIAVTRPRIGMNTFIGLDSYEPGNVNNMVCNCGGNSTGRFCEKPINACDNCLIQNASVCAVSSRDYCPSCPFEYERDGAQCRVAQYYSGGENIHPHSAYLMIVLFCLATFTMWVQNHLASDM